MVETKSTNFTSVPVKTHAFRVSQNRPQKHRRIGTAVSVGRNIPNFALTTLEPLKKGTLPLNLSGM
jgi:hypothetical protein